MHNTKGVVYLTSYRIIWLEALESKHQTRVAMHLEHANVKTVLALVRESLTMRPLVILLVGEAIIARSA